MWRSLLLFALAFVLQTTMVGYLAVDGIRPDLVVLMLVYTALAHGPVVGNLSGFVFGLLQDCYTPGYLGLNALSKGLVGFGIGAIRDYIPQENPLILLALLALTTVAHDLVYFLIYHQGNLHFYATELVQRTLPTMGYTLAVGTILLLLVVLFSRRSTLFDVKNIFPY